MPVRTPHFGLEAFVVGDVYLGVVDERRFRTIDTHLGFISDLIGPGRIDGWDLTVPTAYTLNVSSGWGMINRSITRTFGDYHKSLLDNNSVYIWMRLRPGVIGQLSAFGNISYIEYSDTTPPAQPTGLIVDSKSTDSISFVWNATTELDFDHYEVYRSIDNMTYVLLGETTVSSYLDLELKENSVYYYKVKAYDLSGNASSFSSNLLVVTDQDLSKPSDPLSMRVENSNEVVHVTWNAAPYGNIAYYRAYVTPVTEERIVTGATTIYEVTSDKVDISIDGLTNGQRYLVLLKSVSTNGIESNGITRLVTPIDVSGPPDVITITVTDYAVTSGISTNGLDIIWDSFLDPYGSFAGTAEILIEEYHTDGTVITSDWIPTIEGFTTRTLEVFPYKINGQTLYKSIQSRTTYYITIRNVNEFGQKSLGKRIRHFTKNFIIPESVQSISVTDKQDHSLVLKWDNSPSIFSYNIVSIIKTNLTTSVETILFENENVGRSTLFLLNQSYIEANNRYTFSIYCVDEFNNVSTTRSVMFDVSSIESLLKPPPPQQQIGFAGNRQNTITWNSPQIDGISGYRIYRALDAPTLTSTDFSLLETVSSNIFTYIDHEVENGISYIYFVTTVDIYNQESLNPRDDRYINYTLITLRPVSNSSLNNPTGLTSSIIGQSVELNWQPTGGQFDGYEIYRSVGNKYSFELIATVAPAITFYVDNNILRQTAKVYYIIRKFRNEADLFVTESNLTITNAIYLGKVTTLHGTSTIDLTGSRKIKNLEDPIKEEAKIRIDAHKHKWYSDLDDRRINLSDKLTVSDWETSDNQNYTTQTDISETTTYLIFLNGEDLSSFGLLYSLDKDKGVLTFEQPLAKTGFEIDTSLTFPFAVPPVVTVDFDNLEEVQNILPSGRFDGASSQQITVGIFEKAQIPSISHDGRKKERLEPIKVSMLTVDDGYRYAPVDEKEKLGDAVVFYDVIQSANNIDLLVASTSDGIYTSEDFGVSWNRKFETVTPVVSFFYSERFDTYFAGTNRGILFGRGGDSGGFSIWTEISGTENAKIVRNIVSDNEGNVFCSTDLGVYKLRRDIGQGSFFFQQTPIFGPRSTEAYAIIFDMLRNRLLVSNELGLFESYNSGVRWTFSDEFTEQRPVYAFVQSGGYLFAITDFMLWRRKPNETVFQRIGVMENSSIARKIVIWHDRVYISTDQSLLASIASNDIYNDSTITFETAFAELRNKTFVLPATSLNVIDDKLFVGTEDKILITDRPGKLSLHSEFKSSVIPTVYVNGEAQSIGYRFTTSEDRLRKFVCFDTKQKLGSIVTIANQYQKFVAKHGGWADTNYISSIALFVDGVRMNDMSLAEKPAQAISNLSLPVYNDRNAHKAGADNAQSALAISATKLLEVEKDQNGVITNLKGFTKDNVVSTLYGIERFLSQIYESARVVQITDSQGNISEIPFKIPDFRVALLSTSNRTSLTKFGTFGAYKAWSRDSNNSDSSVIGNFGSELTSDGILPPELIGGDGTKGLIGG